MTQRLHTYLTLTALMALICCSLPAQAHMIRRLSHDDGLPSSSVMSIHSAENGFVWLGTVDGLCIYDGNTIHPFNAHIAYGKLSGNLIHSIHETPQAMWVQTNYGLDRLPKGSNQIDEFTEFREDKTYLSDNKDIIFSVGLSNKLFYYIEGKSKTFQPLEEISISMRVIKNITYRNDTLRIYSGTGVQSYTISQKENGTLSVRKQLANVELNMDQCYGDYDGMMWIIDRNNKIWHFNPETGQKVMIADLSKECQTKGSVFGVARLRNSNELFVGFQWNDVIKLDDIHSNGHPHMTSLGINSGISSMCPDHNQEVVWITTDGNGVYKYIDTDLSLRSLTYSDLGHKISRPVRAIWADDEGTVWIGTKGDGILRLKNFNSDTPYNRLNTDIIETHNSSLLHQEVYAFSSSVRPILWIGTEGGLNYYSYPERTVKTLSFPNGKVPRHIHSIYEESESVIWLAATGEGIYRIELDGDTKNPRAKSVEVFSNDNGNWAMNFFFAIHPNDHGGIYGVNRGFGAVEILNGEMTMLPLLKDYPTRMVNDIFSIETHGDTVWYGTGAGIIRRINNDEYLYDRTNGLKNSTIHGLVLDRNNNLWASTNNGLACLNPSTGNIRLYNHDTGVDVNEFSDGAFCRHGDKMYFGGVNGIVEVSISPTTKHVTVDYSPITFTNLLLGGEHRMLTPCKNGEEAEIGYNENSFAIEVAAPDHINGSHYTFYYKLSQDKEWNIVENNRINFNHLPSGSYELMAYYVDGVTGYKSPVRSLHIEVESPWYQSWWAKILYAIIIIALVAFALYYILKRQKEQQQQRIKELKREQKEKIYEDKLRFFTGITHEFNAPLTLIYGPCERILNHRGIDSYTQRYVKLIRHNAERMNSLIQEIIDFGRIESGAMPRVITKVNISRLCEDILQLFTSLEEQNSVKLVREIDPDLYWNTDLRSFNKILYNLLSNAFKYTPSYGTIKLSLHQDGDNLVLKVFNTGKGIEAKDQKRIFDRYTVFDNMEVNATKGLSSRSGLGMATCKAMVDFLEGSITIESEIGMYAEFIVKLPMLELSSSAATNVLSESIPTSYDKTVEMPEIPVAEDLHKEDAPKTNRKSMLIIDDDAEILHLLTDAMSQEYEVYTAQTAEAGLNIVIDKSPDIIITDIMMAGEGGLWLTKKVKEDKHTTHIPIVMLSAKSTSADKIEGLKSGADAYVAKPFSTDYLREVVRRLLSRRGELKDYFNSSASAFQYVDGKIQSQEDKEFIQKMKDIITECIGESDLTAEAVAEKMNLSVRNLYRKMKAMELPPPIDFIRQQRVKHAAHLLATTTTSIAEIIADCGFNNRSYFYKEFNKLYGMTPKAYRMEKQAELKKPKSKDLTQ